jgi:predicted Zn finger-like uncharacterized protein
VKFLCDQCQAKYQIADEKAAGKTVRMKCRKCGHLIEVRATVVDGSDAMSIPPPGQRPTVGRPSQKPPPPRHAPLATSLASAKAPPRTSDKPGALASAFRSNVQRDDEVSAPVDMSDLSAADEWYVAINGVPVGPIRIAEVRRKAAIGAVTEESLCWQEGLEEWRALRSFPELAAIVREAFASGRSSLTPPPPEGRRSGAPPPPRHSSRPPAPAARSNVVPITSRLATAEKLSDVPDALTRPQPQHAAAPTAHSHSVVPDPFASPPQPARGGAAAIAPPQAFAAPAGAPYVSATPSFSGSLPAGVMPSKKALPWMAIAMVAAAMAFGVTAGIAVFLRPAPAPQPVVVQVPAAPAAVALAAPTTTQTAAATADPTPSPTTSSPRSTLAMATAAKSSAAAAPSATGHGLDLHAISPGSNVLPTDEPGGGDTPKAVAGQGVSGAQVSQVVGLHQVALRRNCWERNPSQKTAVNVSVTFTVAGDGSVQGVSASGDEPSIATCIANDIRGWHFPATGTSQPVNVPFHFVKQ